MVKTAEQRSGDKWWADYVCPMAGVVHWDAESGNCRWANCVGPVCMFFADSYQDGRGCCALAELAHKAAVALDSLREDYIAPLPPIPDWLKAKPVPVAREAGMAEDNEKETDDANENL